MKKTIALFALALLAMSCEKTPEVLTTPGEKMTLSATIESSTRVEINTTDESTFNHFWQDGDQIRVFDGADHGATFDLDGYDALNPSSSANFSGTFAYTPAGAVYPAANADAAFDGTNFTVTFPAVQTYTANTYDPAANVYVATISRSTLNFQPLSCYIRIALWSETASTEVDHIVVSSVGGEKIAGPASVSTAGVITMDSSAGTSITLNCTSPVTLSDNSANPTYFYVAVPAVSVENGLKVDVYKEDGSHLWRNVSVSPQDKKNKVLKMGALEYSPEESSSTATLLSSQSFNAAIKTLAGTDCGATDPYKTSDTNIKKIIFEVNKNMTGVNGTDVSNDSDKSIVASFNEGVIRVQTAASSIKLNSFVSIFRAFKGLVSIENLSALNTSDVESMSYAFLNDSKLKSLDLSGFDTRNAINATQMLSGCSSLEEVIFGENCTFGKTQSFLCMFYNCSSLTSLDLSNFMYESTSNARTCERMFMGCTKLKSISFNPSGLTFRYVTNTNQMFRNCSSLTSVNLANVLNVASGESSSIDMWGMFYDCSSITGIALHRVSFSRAANISSMFNGCDKLESITNIDYVTFAASTRMDSVFYNCQALTSLNVSKFNTANATSMKSFIQNCSNLTTFRMSGDNASSTNLKNAESFMNGCNKLEKAYFGKNFTWSESTVEATSFFQNPESFTAASSNHPFELHGSAALAQNLIQKSEDARTLCNYDGSGSFGASGTRLKFISILSGSDLVLTPGYGSVTSSTTVSEP